MRQCIVNKPNICACNVVKSMISIMGFLFTSRDTKIKQNLGIYYLFYYRTKFLYVIAFINFLHLFSVVKTVGSHLYIKKYWILTRRFTVKSDHSYVKHAAKLSDSKVLYTSTTDATCRIQ